MIDWLLLTSSQTQYEIIGHWYTTHKYLLRHGSSLTVPVILNIVEEEQSLKGSDCRLDHKNLWKYQTNKAWIQKVFQEEFLV